MAMSKFSEFSAALSPSVRENPPISFVSKVRKMEKNDGPDMDKSEWIKLEFLMDPDNPASKYSQQFAVLSSRIDAQRSGSSAQVGDGLP
jgi:hypothetical protein